jgi:hypothetical protein
VGKASLSLGSIRRVAIMLDEEIKCGNDYWVKIDGCEVKVETLHEFASGGWWECETVPIGTRIVIQTEAFVALAGASEQSLHDSLPHDRVGTH